MNHETKILFTDLDGTLLNDQKQISKGNLTAIHKALDCGHKIVISTGRALISARKQAETLGLTMPGCYIIAFNGACIYDIHAKKVIFSQTIPVDYVYALFEEAHRQGIHIQTTILRFSPNPKMRISSSTAATPAWIIKQYPLSEIR